MAITHTQSQTQPLGGRELVAGRPPRSWRRLAWRRFSANRVATASALWLIAMYLVALFAPVVAPYDPNQVDILYSHGRPSREHLLGTDESGRDVLSRLIVGSRASMSVGLIAMAISITLGSVIGSASGYLGRADDSVLMRLTDGMMAIPYFFLVLIVVAVFGSSFRNIVIVIGLTSWMVVARIVRSEVLRLRGLDFVVAARTLGASDTHILLRHIVP